jgi:hypothetical protein
MAEGSLFAARSKACRAGASKPLSKRARPISKSLRQPGELRKRPGNGSARERRSDGVAVAFGRSARIVAAGTGPR